MTPGANCVARKPHLRPAIRGVKNPFFIVDEFKDFVYNALMLNTKSTAELHAELRSTRDAFAQKLRNALTVAGFTVTGKMPTGDWARGLLTITSDTTKEFEVYAEFEIRSAGKWMRSDPSKVRLTYSYSSGYRGNKHRYSKLDDALVVELVKNTKGYLKNVIERIEQRRQNETDAQRWAFIRAEQLAGLVVPPGTEIKIVTGNGPDAGTYRIEFQRLHNSIMDTPLTAAQVRKLVGVLNELQHTANGWVIAGTHGGNGRTYAFGSGGYWSEDDPKLFISEDEAIAHLEKAAKDFAGGQNVRVMAYVSFATI